MKTEYGVVWTDDVVNGGFDTEAAARRTLRQLEENAPFGVTGEVMVRTISEWKSVDD